MVESKDAIEKFRDEPEALEELVEALTVKFTPENAMLLREAMAKQKSLQEVKTAADNYSKKRNNVGGLTRSPAPTCKVTGR